MGSDGLNFYKDLFASLCFIFFGAALAFQHPYLYFAALMCACLSTTAHRKKWPTPNWAQLYIDRLTDYINKRVLKKEFTDDDDTGPLPPIDK